jgi:hypothetical protein
MAEKMANATAGNECELTGTSTTKYNNPARARETKKAVELVTIAPVAEERVPVSGSSECQSAKSNFDFSGILHQAIAKHFDKIVDGLIMDIDQGNPSGAKVLFATLARLKADPDKVELQSEAGVILSNLLGPGFDLFSEQHEQQHNAAENPEAVVDGGTCGRKTE